MGGFVVVSGCSLGCGVVDWILGVVLQFNVEGRNSCCVISLGYVVLGRLSCGCVVTGRVVLVRFSVVLDRFGIEIGWSLGVVSWGSIRSRVVLGDFGVVGWDSILCGVVLRSLGAASRCCVSRRCCVVRRRRGALFSLLLLGIHQVQETSVHPWSTQPLTIQHQTAARRHS